MILSFDKIEFHDLMRYYVCFCDIENKLIGSINGENKEEVLKNFKYYMNNHMKIGRNFKTDSDEKVLNITKKYYENNGSSIDELSQLYKDNKLLNERIENALVAASKLLWLFDPNTIIMDNINREKLGIKEYNYNLYASKWIEIYQNKRTEICQLVDKHNLLEINPIFGKEWFQMRVFDQYLWRHK